ncbi:MAG: DUF3352 domain-containing protein [Bacteroidia bacterium]
MKYAKWLLGIIVLLAISLWAYFVWTPYKQIDPLQLIPNDAVYILETEEPLDHWEAFYKSPFWQFLSKHPYLNDLSSDANYLDSLLNENRALVKFFGDHHFILSAHMLNNQDYDFLMAVDLKRAAKFSLESFPFGATLGTDKYAESRTEYRDQTIIGIKNKEDGDETFLVKLENYLVFSFNQTLLHLCIDQHLSDDLLEHSSFELVYKKVERDGLGQFYLNYRYLDDYLGVYMPVSSTVEHLASQLSYSAFDLHLGVDAIEVEGFTSISDKSAYAQLLLEQGNSSPSFHKVLSSRIAALQSIHIDHVKTYYQELIALRETEQADMANYKKLKLQFEKLLQLNLEEDMLSWIGDEIVVARSASYNYNQNTDNTILALKVSDLELANLKLEKIQAQIKKRSPAKFKHVSYRGYAIHYLDIKGLFKFFLGSAFDKIQHPYYVQLGEFIIFSNNPKTLVAFIDDYENDMVLAKDESFMKVLGQMPSELTIFSYINSQLLYPVLEQEVLYSYKEPLRNNETYFNYFNRVALAYKSKDKHFENELYISYGQDKEALSVSNVDSLYNEYAFTLSQEAEQFIAEEIEGGTYYKYFPNSKKVMIKAAVKKGIFHGKYFEYHPNLELKIKGQYKRGKKTGKWLYYNTEGQQIGRERF